MKRKISYNMDGVYKLIDMNALPSKMDVEILLDIGENSNSNKLQKLEKIGAEVLPALNNNGAGIVVRPEAPAVLATQIIESMNMDSNDFLEDYNTEEFRQRAAESVEQQTQDAGLAISIDKHFQEWAELGIKATKEGTQVPPHPSYNDILMMAQQLLGGTQNGNSNT
jgi:hypothetical protein